MSEHWTARARARIGAEFFGRTWLSSHASVQIDLLRQMDRDHADLEVTIANRGERAVELLVSVRQVDRGDGTSFADKRYAFVTPGAEITLGYSRAVDVLRNDPLLVETGYRSRTLGIESRVETSEDDARYNA